MSKAKYEIEVDAADDYDNSMDHNVKGNVESVILISKIFCEGADLKSTVMKKKGRGFSSSSTILFVERFVYINHISYIPRIGGCSQF